MWSTGVELIKGIIYLNLLAQYHIAVAFMKLDFKIELSLNCP